nr:unnamed protein product [Callosobruchus chinensis]
MIPVAIPVSTLCDPAIRAKPSSIHAPCKAESSPNSLTATCPPVDGPRSQYFPHETNCSLFYQCSNGVPYLQECPSGLYFNPKIDVCDYPRNVDCHNKNGTTEAPWTTTTNAPSTQSTSNPVTNSTTPSSTNGTDATRRPTRPTWGPTNSTTSSPTDGTDVTKRPTRPTWKPTWRPTRSPETTTSTIPTKPTRTPCPHHHSSESSSSSDESKSKNHSKHSHEKHKHHSSESSSDESKSKNHSKHSHEKHKHHSSKSSSDESKSKVIHSHERHKHSKDDKNHKKGLGGTEQYVSIDILNLKLQSKCMNMEQFYLTSHPYDCAKYVICDYGDAVEGECPEGFAFSSDIAICVAKGFEKCRLSSRF